QDQCQQHVADIRLLVIEVEPADDRAPVREARIDGHVHPEHVTHGPGCDRDVMSARERDVVQIHDLQEIDAVEFERIGNGIDAQGLVDAESLNVPYQNRVEDVGPEV